MAYIDYPECWQTKYKEEIRRMYSSSRGFFVKIMKDNGFLWPEDTTREMRDFISGVIRLCPFVFTEDFDEFYHGLDLKQRVCIYRLLEDIRMLIEKPHAILTPTHCADISRVIFNDPATIVFWSDGTKTVVKATNEPYDPEKGLAMAIAKHSFGNEGNYYNEFRKWLPKKPEKSPPESVPEAFQKAFNEKSELDWWP